MEHFRQPVDSSIRIASSNAFDECADRVVMLAARAIIDDGLFLNTLLCHSKIDVDGAISLRLCREGCDFQSI